MIDKNDIKVIVIGGVSYVVIFEATNCIVVNSFSGKIYNIDVTTEPWKCDCPDFIWRRRDKKEKCKHIDGVGSLLAPSGKEENGQV